MARRKLACPVRERLVEQIDALMVGARENIQLAQDIADLLNALDTSGDKIEIDGNVVTGLFTKKEAK
jgi:hypothetical protein